MKSLLRTLLVASCQSIARACALADFDESCTIGANLARG